MTGRAKSETHAHSVYSESPLDEKDFSAQPRSLEATFDAFGGAPSPWGSGHLQLYGACFLIYLCSTMNGKC